jgi:FMN phosphatase YigB (HAD superfamily)
MKIHSYVHCALISILLSSSACAKVFIFDFGGVLLFNDKFTSFRHIGMRNAAECSIRLGINPFYLDEHIKKTLFTTLNKIEHIHSLNTEKSYHIAYDEKGNELPYFLCAWLQGTMKGYDIRNLVHYETEQHPEWFGCCAEKRIVQNLTQFILTPELFADSMKVSQAGIAFIKRCKKEGHAVYGLSNWDADSFEIIKKNHPELFDLFDGIVVSAHVHANKPHESIYRILLDMYQLEAQNCWFIDDQKENITAAQKLGINAILHHQDFHNVASKIRAYPKIN